MFWLRNPLGSKSYKEGQPWEKTDIGFSTYAKDILTTDFNRDGKIDSDSLHTKDGIGGNPEKLTYKNQLKQQTI